MKHHQIEVDHMTEKTVGHGIVTTSKIHAGGNATPVEPLQSAKAVAAPVYKIQVAPERNLTVCVNRTASDTDTAAIGRGSSTLVV